MKANHFAVGVFLLVSAVVFGLKATEIKGTWYTGAGDEFAPDTTISLKPGVHETPGLSSALRRRQRGRSHPAARWHRANNCRWSMGGFSHAGGVLAY